MVLRLIAILGVLILGAGSVLQAAEGLAGSTWRLVKIMSMDDRVDAPADRSKYTLELRADGRATMRADCNRGMGAWASESAGRLQFGPVASTRALCPPGSLSGKYLAQFEWVRSYVVKDGLLFLATMADGSIIEFEPAGGSAEVATVLDEEVRKTDAAEMQQTILERLFERYAAEHGIEATDMEIDAFVRNTEHGMAESGLTAEQDLTPEESAELATMRRDMGRAIIRQWKINKSLYDRYGGRIVYQQLGPEPLDAYRQYLREQQRQGAFTIHDSTLADGFWKYFTDDSIHDFMEAGGVDERTAFTTPPWERKP